MGALEETMERIDDLTTRNSALRGGISTREQKLTKLRKFGEMIQDGTVTANPDDLDRATSIMDQIETEVIALSGVFP